MRFYNDFQALKSEAEKIDPTLKVKSVKSGSMCAAHFRDWGTTIEVNCHKIRGQVQFDTVRHQVLRIAEG